MLYKLQKIESMLNDRFKKDDVRDDITFPSTTMCSTIDELMELENTIKEDKVAKKKIW